MTNKNSGIILAGNELDENPSPEAGTALVRRGEILPGAIPENNCSAIARREESSIIKVIGSREFSEPRYLPSRRNFLITSAAATAGMMIAPNYIFAGGIKDTLRDFFFNFGKDVLLNQFSGAKPGAGIFSGFAGIAQAIIGAILGKGWGGWDFVNGCFGNNEKETLVDSILGRVGSSSQLNSALSYINKKVNDQGLLIGGPSYLGIQPMIKKVLGIKENLKQAKLLVPSTAGLLTAGLSDAQAQKILLKQEIEKMNRYLMPFNAGFFSKYARETMSEPTALTSSYVKPQFYETEAGGLVLVTYTSDPTRFDRQGKPIGGNGESVSYNVPTQMKQKILDYINGTGVGLSHSNFWSNDEVRADFIGVIEDNSGPGTHTQEIAFESE
jgi:hypothetical protein